MRYYVSKPNSHDLDQKLVEGILRSDAKATFVTDINEADICVFQTGWTTSRTCTSLLNTTLPPPQTRTPQQ